MPVLRRLTHLSPGRIAGGYLLFGGLWILLSDALVHLVVQQPALITRVQTVKGWVFVLVSGALILGLVRVREHQLQSSRDRLARATEELHVLHRVFRHNIRNDLNVVRGYVDLVRSAVDDATLEQQLGRAHRSTDRILGVSEKLRMIEAANAQARNADTVDVVELIGQETERLLDEYPEVSVDVDGPARAWVYADETLGYAIRELLENAVEHHEGPPEACEITVAVDRTVSSVTIEIGDNGPGIPAFEIEALESGEEAPLAHASGIGLWLVKWLCLFFDGEVTFERPPAGGTTARLAFEPALRLDAVIEQAWNELPLQAEA